MISTMCRSFALAGFAVSQTPSTVPVKDASLAASYDAPSTAEVWDSSTAGNRRFVAAVEENMSSRPLGLFA
jgi:hypothetical protein